MKNIFVSLVDEEKLDERAKMSVAAKRSLFRVYKFIVYICINQIKPGCVAWIRNDGQRPR